MVTMKHLLLSLALLLSMAAGATRYKGTLRMASGFTLTDVTVSLDANGDLTLYRVKFARMMPVRVDVLIPQVTLRGDSLYADGIVPTMKGKPKQDKIVTQLTGTADARTITFRCFLGGKEMFYSGHNITRP